LSLQELSIKISEILVKNNDISHIIDMQREGELKMEVLDYYPNDRPIDSIAYLQGIEKV